MDTLIDNRNFPPEMQQIPEFKQKEKSTPWLLIILVVFAVGIIVFLLCNIFMKKNNIVNNEVKTNNLEKKVEKVHSFNTTIPTLTNDEREKKVHSFFN